MKKVIGFVLLTAALGGCATFGGDESNLSPSAMISTQYQRCERDSRLAIAAPPAFPMPGSLWFGDSDVARDVNRNIYWSCAGGLPTTK